MNHKQRNARKKQRKRAAQNNAGVKYQDKLYQMIDKNFTHYPYGYCKYHKGWLTKSLALIHKCEKRNCVQFEKGVD